jgi:hypothetical protein
MPVILCQHCREPWDTDTLIDDAVGVFTLQEIEQIAPLNTLVDVWIHIPEHKRDGVIALLAPLGDPDHPVVTAFTFWWSGNRPDSDPLSTAAKNLVGTAMCLAVERGLGCPDCGFDHTAATEAPALEKES